MKHRFEPLDIEDSGHIEALEQVANWSAERASMKFYTVDELKRHPLAVVAFRLEERKFLGHVALTEIDSVAGELRGRIGAFAVAEAEQRNGLGENLIRNILKLGVRTFPEVKGFYAHVHQSSLSPFKKNNARVICPRTPSVETGCNIIVSINPDILTSDD